MNGLLVWCLHFLHHIKEEYHMMLLFNLKKPEMKYFVILLLFAFSASSFASSLPRYKKGDLISAKSIAKSENKFVLVKFYADWCLPCKWMDETTFSDPSVNDKLERNFVSLKVNIDDFDGFELRQDLKVSVLPTILVYDPNGKMVKRLEEPLTTTKMMKFLDNVVMNNGGTITRQINQSPSKLNKADSKKSVEATYKRKSFKLQLGVFNGFENTMNFLDSVKEKIDEQAMVLHDYKDGKTMYKVLIGRYKTHEEAYAAQQKLKLDRGMDSVIY